MVELTEKAGKTRTQKAPPPSGLEPLAALAKDLRVAALTLGDNEARFLVDTYYDRQDSRIRAGHQVRSLAKAGEPNGVLRFFEDQSQFFEAQVFKALDTYSQSRPIGIWGRSLLGVGPIIVAGLMANIDITQAPTVGHIWRFAGLDPTSAWLPKTRRPWNASLKRLCFIVGESFTKFQNHPADEERGYGHVFRKRRTYEINRNDAGVLTDQARVSLETKNYGTQTEALAWYSGCYPAGACRQWNDLELEARAAFPDDSAKRTKWLNQARETYLLSVRVSPGEGLPMLPPARILLRAQRYATKLFLSHWHYVLHETHYGVPPPHPYVLDEKAHLSRPDLAVHTHFIGPPNWPMKAAATTESAAIPE